MKVGYETRHYDSRSLNCLGEREEMVIPRVTEVLGLVKHKGETLVKAYESFVNVRG